MWLVVLTTLLLPILNAKAASTNSLTDAEIQGRALVKKILEQQPENNYTNSGVLDIRDAQGRHIKIPVQFEVVMMRTGGWQAIYSTEFTNTANADPAFGRLYFCQLAVIHSDNQRNLYRIPNVNSSPADTDSFVNLTDDQIMVPFARSDFWFADLGLEFFHWPEQRVLPKTTNLKRGRDYTLLESTNPHPTASGYSRVVSWIDKESNGILEAEAFDANGKELKYFEPENFEKVNGQYQVESMVMENVQTGSKSVLEFDLNK